MLTFPLLDLAERVQSDASLEESWVRIDGAAECIQHSLAPYQFATVEGGPAMAVHHNTRPIPERFWAKVQKTNTCWLWTAGLWGNGYGQFGYGKIGIGAHRMSWWLAHGPIPTGLNVLHTCDTPACVNPDHLFLGTQKDNAKDMILKRRHAHGDVFRGKTWAHIQIDWAKVKVSFRSSHSKPKRVCARPGCGAMFSKPGHPEVRHCSRRCSNITRVARRFGATA